MNENLKKTNRKKARRVTNDDISKMRTLYVYKGWSADRISKEMDIHKATISKYKKLEREAGDDWDNARSIAKVGIGNLAEQTLEDFSLFARLVREKIKNDHSELDAVQQVKLMGDIATAFSKMSLALERIKPALSEIHIAQRVVGELKEFIRSKYPQHFEAFVEILEPFAQHISQKMKT